MYEVGELNERVSPKLTAQIGDVYPIWNLPRNVGTPAVALVKNLDDAESLVNAANEIELNSVLEA